MTRVQEESAPLLLADAVALITGGSRGIGLATARRFIEAGARVVITGRHESVLDVAAGLGQRAEGRVCDVSVESDVVALVDDIVTACGRLDVLVNNAGVTRDAMLHKMEVADFRAVTDVNLQGAFVCIREAMRHMRRTGGGGSIVNISSMSGKLGNLGQAGYAASKAGVEALTKVAAREGATRGIRVNAIRPGLIATDMAAGLSAEAKARIAETIPMARAGEPCEVAEVALFLASAMSSYVTGTVIDVAGGRGM